MKKTIIMMFLFAFCLAVCLAACGSGPDGEMSSLSSHESAGEEASSDTEPLVSIEYTPDLYDALYKTYLHAPMRAGILFQTWPQHDFYLGEEMTAFYGLHYLDVNPSYTGDLTWSKEEMFAYIDQYFHTDSYYNRYYWDRDTYTWDGKSHARAVNITKATRTGDELTIAYTYSEKDDDETPAANCEIQIELTPDGYQYISNKVAYTEYKKTLDQSTLDEVMEKYVRPLGLGPSRFTITWEKPEDLGQMTLIGVLAFNDFIDSEDRWESKSIYYAKGDAVEKVMQQYFGVSADFLRASELYNPEDHTYILVQGGGGGSISVLYDVQTKDDLMFIKIGIHVLEEKYPSWMMRLTIRLREDGFTYLSNESWPR